MNTSLTTVLDLVRARTVVARQVDHSLGSFHGLGLNDLALLLDSSMIVEGAECEFGFLFVPDENGVSELLGRLGLWEQDAA